MTYVMSDLHGMYEKYIQMLDVIGFSDEDTLIINGDICDRGPRAAEIYLDVMNRDNVTVIKGNHEVMAEIDLERLYEEFRGYSIEVMYLIGRRDLWTWFNNGGDRTVKSISYETEEDRYRILDFIKSLPLYKIITVCDKRYVIVHGGLGNFTEGMTVEDVPPHDLLWTRPNFDDSYMDDGNTYLIVGHTPTLTISREGGRAKIYHGKGNVIAIDCGAVFEDRGGRLGCLCIDTGEEFYV